VASFVPPLLDPENPNAVANWAREVADTINGQISIGEPLATLADGTGGLDTLRPNGVKGHLLGSFVDVEIGTGDLAVAITCTHNLNIINKGTTPLAESGNESDLNVCWVIVRTEHDGTGPPVNVDTISCNFQTGDTVTDNSIQLRFHAVLGGRTVADASPIYLKLWFFPTTR